MAMEIPVLNEYFENISEVKDARFRDQCTIDVIHGRYSKKLKEE